ncbi:MAG: hypothetical protein QXX17_05145 [Conexivisphaerales archaeon]
MVRIYLDVVTYRPTEEAFIGEKIIALGILNDITKDETVSLKENIEPTIFAEWEGYGQKEILKRFYDKINEIENATRFTVPCGFNILRFDIPFIITRTIIHKLMKTEDAMKFWNKMFAIDYFQMMLFLNDSLFKGLSLQNIVLKAKELGLDPRSLRQTGQKMKNLYKQQKFHDIKEHLVENLNVVRGFDLRGAKDMIKKEAKTNGQA